MPDADSGFLQEEGEENLGHKLGIGANPVPLYETLSYFSACVM